jgi:signal transduction histidine kinase
MNAPESPDLALEGLVHDLNNIFDTIQDAADLIAADPKFVRMATTLRRSANRGSRILNSFLESSMASLEFDSIVDQAVEFVTDFQQSVRGAQIEFVRRVEPGVRLRGNPTAWERVLVNLFANAARAMENRGTIEVSAGRGAEGIQIVVADNGPGIPAKILPHIFDAHFTTRTSRARRSGLGLHIVQSIVQQYGGTVTAVNRPNGNGAEFRIVLSYA